MIIYQVRTKPINVKTARKKGKTMFNDFLSGIFEGMCMAANMNAEYSKYVTEAKSAGAETDREIALYINGKLSEMELKPFDAVKVPKMEKTPSKNKDYSQEFFNVVEDVYVRMNEEKWTRLLKEAVENLIKKGGSAIAENNIAELATIIGKLKSVNKSTLAFTLY